MRRLMALLVLAALTLAACHSSEPIFTTSGARVHWQQNIPGSLERHIRLIVPEAYASDASFMQAMNFAVGQADRSPYVDMTLEVVPIAPTSCPTTHCITVVRAPMNGGYAAFGYTDDGHMFGRAGEVGFDSAPWNQAVLNNAACHEIAGHMLGLAHSSDGTQGPCQGGLTAHDLANIDGGHNHADAVVYPAMSTAELEREHGPRRWHTHRHDRGFYEALSRRR